MTPSENQQTVAAYISQFHGTQAQADALAALRDLVAQADLGREALEHIEAGGVSAWELRKIAADALARLDGAR